MRRNSHISLLLVILVALTYWPARDFGFLVYDDQVHVSGNPYINPPTTERLWYIWRFPFDRTPVPGIDPISVGPAPPYQSLYAPLAFTTWGFLAILARDLTVPVAPGQAVPLDPSIYHSFNILLHLCNALLVLALLRRLIKSEWAAVAGAALFALHPLQVESVCWITGLNTLLSTTASLLALYAILRAIPSGNVAGEQTDEGPNRPRYHWGWWILATLAYILAVLTKPGAVVLPVLIPLLVWATHPRRLKVLLLSMVPWLALAALITWVNMQLPAPDLTPARVEAWQRPFLVGDALKFYLGKLLVPIHLVTDYGRKPAVVLQSSWTYFLWMIPAAVIGGLFLMPRSRRQPFGPTNTRLVVAGGLWFFVALLPTSGIVTYYYHLTSTVADRYAYFPLIGAAITLSAIVASPRASKLLKAQRLPVTVVAVALVLGVQSYSQVFNWADDQSLWLSTLKVNPKSLLAYGGLSELALKNNKPAEALQYAQAGIKLAPENPQLLFSRAEAYRGLGQWELAAESFAETLRVYPTYVLGRVRWGNMLMKNGDYKGAQEQFYEAWRLSPEDPGILASLGVAYARTGNAAMAERHLAAALTAGLQPGVGYTLHANSLADLGRHAEALSEYSEALANGGREDRIHYNRGVVLFRQGKVGMARDAFSKSLTVNPGHELARQAIKNLTRNQTGGHITLPLQWM